jgi:hypothetical protein
MPDVRDIGPADADRIRIALAGVRAAQEELEKSVAQALLNGASVRAVAELGLSPNTVQKYGRAHGWPTELNRARFYEFHWTATSGRAAASRAGGAAPPIACRRPMEPDRIPRCSRRADASNVRVLTLPRCERGNVIS